MTQQGMYSSLSRSAGDLAGVFEHDGAVGYFYLYNAAAPKGQRVIGAIRVAGRRPPFREEDVGIVWSVRENMVAIYILEQMCAVFDCETGEMFGGDYHPGSTPEFPACVKEGFQTTGPPG